MRSVIEIGGHGGGVFEVVWGREAWGIGGGIVRRGGVVIGV